MSIRDVPVAGVDFDEGDYPKERYIDGLLYIRCDAAEAAKMDEDLLDRLELSIGKLAALADSLGVEFGEAKGTTIDFVRSSLDELRAYRDQISQ